jgi:transcriptional regulator with XRE-family HTH domain
MTATQAKTSLLGEQIRKRLTQLGMSRREFCRRFNISRQTMHDLEHATGKGFAESTFHAVDIGLKWEPGTAMQFHRGNKKAREVGVTVEERINNYLTNIVSHLLTMTIDDLEREVLMLEEEAYGRPLPAAGSEAMVVIRETVRRLTMLRLETRHHDIEER